MHQTMRAPLRTVVLENEPTIVEHAHQGVLLADGVAQGGAEQAALLADLLVLEVRPGEEGQAGVHRLRLKADDTHLSLIDLDAAVGRALPSEQR